MSTLSPFSTSLSSRLGLRYPIVAAPMFLISGREMIVAAAEAGIVGAMPSLNARTFEQLKSDLEWIRERTDKPFAINVTIGLTDPERLEQDTQLLLDFEVPIIITSYGDPTQIVKRAHDKGLFVMHDVIHLKHAQKAQAAGVDAIIGVSAGAGGHAGRISPYALIPWLKDNLNVPIVAAGCISTGKQMAASFALGAELCYLGTRFIASTECRASDAYKKMVTEAGPDDIVYTDAVSGIHANFLKATIPDGTEASRGPDSAKRWKDIWSAGQGVVEIDEVKPIAAIVEDLVREYHDAKAALP
jgi:nitronate monooxygenase